MHAIEYSKRSYDIEVVRSTVERRCNHASRGAAIRSQPPARRWVIADAARARPVSDIPCTGGVIEHALLLSRASSLLRYAGFTILTHLLVPPNDGAHALEETMIAALRCRETRARS
jgi:hydrogenase maturation factor HypF (carbamoyltransferase family)